MHKSSPRHNQNNIRKPQYRNKFNVGDEVYLNVYAGNLKPELSFACKGIVVRWPCQWSPSYKVVITEVSPKPFGHTLNEKEASRLLGLKFSRRDAQLSKTQSSFCSSGQKNIEWLKLSKEEINDIRRKIKAGKFKSVPPPKTGSTGIKILRETNRRAPQRNYKHKQEQRGRSDRPRHSRNTQ